MVSSVRAINIDGRPVGWLTARGGKFKLLLLLLLLAAAASLIIDVVVGLELQSFLFAS